MNTSNGILGQMQSSTSTKKRSDLWDDASNTEPPPEFSAAKNVRSKHSTHPDEQPSNIAGGAGWIM